MRLLRLVAILALGLLLVVLAVPVGVWLGLRSEAGTAWLLPQVPGLKITGPRGPLLGDFSAERVEWLLPGAGDRLVLEEPAWTGLALARSPDAGVWFSVRLATLSARRATLSLAPRPPSPTPSAAPERLRSPVSARIDALRLGEFAMAELGAPLRELSARLDLGAEGGSRHRIEDLRLLRDRLRLAGSLDLGADAPLPVRLRLRAEPVAVAGAPPPAPGPGASAPTAGPASTPSRTTRSGKPGAAGELAANPRQPGGRSGAAPAAPATAAPSPWEQWVAEARLDGPLARSTLQASVTLPGREQPLLDARVVVLPFAAWPLADLQASTRGLDLAAFASGAPVTALSGEARIRASGLDRAAEADIALDNAAAGRWNEGRLPLRSLRLTLQARPDRPEVATLQRFEAELGTARQSAGRLSGSGGLDQGRWTLDATLSEVQAELLDARAPAGRWSGQWRFAGAPADAAGGAAAPGASSPRRGASGPSAALPPAAAASATLYSAQGSLRGRIDPRALRPEPAGATRAERRRSAGAAPARTSTPAGRAVQDVQLALDAQARVGDGGALQLDVARLDATAGASRAQASGRASRRDEGAPWQIAGQATLTEFDPRPWWPGADGSAWQRGPHRLNGRAVADLSLAPATAPVAPARTRTGAAPAPGGSDPFAALSGLRGTLQLTLAPSVLAGVPLDGDLRAALRGDAPTATQVDASATLNAAGNRLKARLAARADRPADDALDLEVDAPALAALSPAAELLGLVSPPATVRNAPRQTALAGRVGGQLSLAGRWPAVRTRGQLEAQGLRVADAGVRSGRLRWQLGTAADSPAELRAELDGITVGSASAEAARVEVNGSARAHRITASVDSRALPPAWVERLGTAPPPPAAVTLAAPAASVPAGSTPTPPAQAVRPAAPVPVGGPSPTTVRLQAEGALQFAGPGAATYAASGWKGRVQELLLRSGSGAGQVGLRTRDLSLDAAWPAGEAARVALQAGRAELQAGATQGALRWNTLRWQAGLPAAAGRPAGAPRLDVEAELEPLAVAPILARLQPDFGWGGDLQVGARLSLQSSPRVKADLVLERRRGDLTVTDEVGTQTLGLTDLRLAVAADNGVWNFTQALAGSTLGVAAGAIVARTGSDTAWPSAGTPIEGVLELRVANLGAWGPWVPAGWRLGGALQTSASLSGRLGAPEYTGTLRGSALSVRNFAEGVAVSDGEVAIALQGSSARIETFRARAGDGTVTLSGGASLGEAPQASLSLRAERFQLLGRVDRRIVASGQGQLQLDAQRIGLDGQFTVDEGLVDFTRGDAPSLSEDVVVIRPPKGSTPAAATRQLAEQKAGVAASRLGREAEVARQAGTGPAAKPAAPTRAVALNLRVGLGERLRLRGRGLDTGLRGELRITSPGGRLAVNGTVSTQGGTYAAYGQKLTIDRGAVIFTGSVDNPRLDIEATRPNTDVRVGVVVGGTAANPRIRLFSEPELPEVDKLSWLVLGRATDGLGRTDTALLQRAAMALLSGEGEGMTTRLTRAIGLDDVSLRQTDGEVRETVISVGKQLSARWYLGYERGLNATAGSWQLIYRIAQRLTLRAQTGAENALDVIWTWRWQ